MSALPQVQPRVFSPLIDNFSELDSFLRGAIINASAVLDDDETAQSAGAGAQDRARGRIAAYDQVRREIAHLVQQERDERAAEAAAESVEARYKDAYGDEPLAAWQAEGR